MFRKGDIVRLVETKRGSGIFHTLEMKVLSMYKDNDIWYFICEYENKNKVKQRTYPQDFLIYIRSSRKSRIRKLLFEIS